MLCLILEQNRTITNILKSGMSAYGYKVDNFKLEKEATYELTGNDYKIIFLDLTKEKNLKLDKIKAIVDSAYEISKYAFIVGVLMQGEWKGKVTFLNAGGDEVITYPFVLQEVLARLQSLLRRPKMKIGNIIQAGDYYVDTLNKCVYKEKGDAEVALRKKEYHLLEYMVRNKERPISRSELMDHVWDYRKIISSNTVDAHMSNLRKKLGDEKCLIKTVHGFGYKLCDDEED